MARRKAGEDVLDWARRNPKLVNAAANLRISGISEEAIFRAFRGAEAHTTPAGRVLGARPKLLREPPSYLQLRAALKEKGIGSRADATALRQARTYFRADGTAYTAERYKGGTSRYLSRRNDRIANPTPRSRDLLEQHTIVGRTLAAQDDPAAYDPDSAIVDFLESEYEGYPV